MRSTQVLGGALLVAVVSAASGSGASPSPAATGKFTLEQNSYEFVDAVAFRTTKLMMWPGERVTVVVMAADPIDRGKVAAAVAQEGNWTGGQEKARFILRFDQKGKLLWGMFQAGGWNIGLLQLGDVQSELSQAGGKVQGRAALTKPALVLGKHPYTFDVAFQADVVASR